MTKNTKTVIILLVIAALIAIVPLFALKGAEFGGSDDAGSEMISEIQGIVAFVLGRFVERKKWQDKENGDSTSSK